MTKAAELAATLTRAWNTRDPKERRDLLLRICRPDATFRSPHGANDGVESYARGIDIFRKAFPHAEVAHGTPDAHHEYLRFPWTTRWNDGRGTMEGVDFGEIDQHGRLVRLVAFEAESPASATGPPEPALGRYPRPEIRES